MDEPENADKIPPPAGNMRVPENLRDLIASQPFFKGLTSRQIDLLAESAMEREFAAGESIIEEGDPANRFYFILEGRVLLELEVPEQERVPVQTLGPGDDLGWSWLFPPYSLQFSARAVQPTRVIFFYGTRLRVQCEEDPKFGYELMKRAAGAMQGCLTSIRQEFLKRLDTR